ATYNESERIIESIASIVRSVDRVCTLPNVEYGAKVKFPKNNPYFGLYTKRIRAGEVVAFEAIFKPTLDRTGSAAANTVTVGRDAVSVACRDIGSWVLLSKKYLAAR
ncbi:MAG TPA: hypothetical protein VFX98_07895, partial [Longimicrobiaceae bacterium]|nr:hypothetical protein [Longimicrobiaceae bacterium]